VDPRLVRDLPGRLRHAPDEPAFDLPITLASEVRRVEEGHVHVADGRPPLVAVEVVPHDVADGAGPDDPLWEVFVTHRGEGAHEPAVGGEDVAQRLLA
jgi:hypothetical protein